MDRAARNRTVRLRLLNSFKKTQAIDMMNYIYLKHWDKSNRRTDIASKSALSGRSWHIFRETVVSV